MSSTLSDYIDAFWYWWLPHLRTSLPSCLVYRWWILESYKMRKRESGKV